MTKGETGNTTIKEVREKMWIVASPHFIQDTVQGKVSVLHLLL